MGSRALQTWQWRRLPKARAQKKKPIPKIQYKQEQKSQNELKQEYLNNSE